MIRVQIMKTAVDLAELAQATLDYSHELECLLEKYKQTLAIRDDEIAAKNAIISVLRARLEGLAQEPNADRADGTA